MRYFPFSDKIRFFWKLIIVYGIVFGFSSSQVSCAKRKGTTLPGKQNVDNEDKNNSSNSDDKNRNGRNDDDYTERKLLDPKKAKLKLTDKFPDLMEASEASSLEVPGFEIRREDANFVQVLRCKTEFQFMTKLAKEITDKNVSELTYDQRKWAWTEAFQNRQCKVVGMKVARTTILDFSAKSGSYFYILNPCVDAKNSKTKKEGCSFNLAITKPIEDYANYSNEEFLEKAEELANLEAEIQAATNILIYNAQRMPDAFKTCELDAITDAEHERFLAANRKLGLMVVGAVVGGIMSGGIGAIQGANTALRVGDMLWGRGKKPIEFECEEAEELNAQSNDAYDSLENLAVEAVEIRREMADHNADYQRIDQIIKGEYTDSTSKDSKEKAKKEEDKEEK